MELLNGLFTLGFNLISILFTITLGITAALIAWTKGRNPYLWGFGTLFFPWAIIIIFLMPRKLPKLRSYLKDKPEFLGKNPVIASIMALSAIVAKADGSVSREEVALIQRFLTGNFGISSSELASYQSAFNYGKEHQDEYKEFVRVIRTFHNNRSFVLSLSYLFLMIGLSNGSLSATEDESIREIILEMGLTEYEYQRLKLYFMNSKNDYSGYYQRQTASGFQRPQEDLTEKYSNVLGINKDADSIEIKKAYRKMAKEYHPDKMAQDGMPDEYQVYATQKIKEINEAYEYLKKVKG